MRCRFQINILLSACTTNNYMIMAVFVRMSTLIIIDVRVRNGLLQALIKRYSDRDGNILFNDYIQLMAKLTAMDSKCTVWFGLLDLVGPYDKAM